MHWYMELHEEIYKLFSPDLKRIKAPKYY